MISSVYSKQEATRWLNEITQGVVNSSEAAPLRLTSDWANSMTDQQGIYLVFARGELVYVGESGCIRKRMLDLLDSRHHQLRRNMGERLFRNRSGFKKASSKDAFPPHIEKLLKNYMEKNLSIVAFPVYLGRVEIEEHLFENRKPIYNKKGRRT